MTIVENRDLAFHEHRCEFLGNPALHSRSHLAEFGEVTAEMARDERTGGRSLAEAVDALRITRIHNVFSFFVFCRSLRQITEGRRPQLRRSTRFFAPDSGTPCTVSCESEWGISEQPVVFVNQKGAADNATRSQRGEHLVVSSKRG